MRLKNAIHASTYIRGYPMPTLYIADAERDVGMKNLSRKEAAKVLEDMKVKIEIPKAAVTQWKRNAALDMAIEALKYSEVPNSSDCISRQAAITAIQKAYADTEGGTDKCAVWKNVGLTNALNIMQDLPSAQPETAKRIVGKSRDGMTLWYQCDMCNEPVDAQDNFCRGCGRRLIDG